MEKIKDVMPILSIRTRNCLLREFGEDFLLVDLKKKKVEELIGFKNFGLKALADLEKCLNYKF